MLFSTWQVRSFWNLPSVQEHLIVFTRYPESGKAKTRLIPALGAEGAAELHRHLAEHTIAQTRALQKLRPVSIEVQFTGGDVQQMQNWLGTDLQYQPQSSGDLGDRLIHAFQSAFDRGAKSVIAIGTDCPNLEAQLLYTAFAKLRTTDVILGPASDGGYYLVGLKVPFPALFLNIDWSTHLVLQQTLEIINHNQLALISLPTLNDIDRPEDLQYLSNEPRKNFHYYSGSQ